MSFWPSVTLPVDLARVTRLQPAAAGEPCAFDVGIPHEGRATVYVVVEDRDGVSQDPIVFYVPGDIDYGVTAVRIEAHR